MSVQRQQNRKRGAYRNQNGRQANGSEPRQKPYMKVELGPITLSEHRYKEPDGTVTRKTEVDYRYAQRDAQGNPTGRNKYSQLIPDEQLPNVIALLLAQLFRVADHQFAKAERQANTANGQGQQFVEQVMAVAQGDGEFDFEDEDLPF